MGDGPWAARASRDVRRRLRTTPDRLIALVIVLVVACVLFGVACVATMRSHSGAARNLASSDGRLLQDAQQIYVSLADADTTAASTYLAGGTEPAASRQRYLDDISRAQFALADVIRSGGSAVRGQVDTMTGQIPVYVGLVDTARANNLVGQPVGGAYLGEASTVMRVRLLPAADGLYAIEADRVRADQDRGAAFAWPALLVCLLVLALLVIAQIGLSRRTRRTFNLGLVGATGATVLAMIWLLVALGIEHSDVERSRTHGSTQLELLARAEIAGLRGRTDECLTLVTGGEDATYVNEYPPILAGLDRDLTQARGSGQAATGAAISSAQGHAARWQEVHGRLVSANGSGDYHDAVALTIGQGPGDVPQEFGLMRSNIDAAAGTDQQTFERNVAAARDATGYLTPVLVLLMVLAAAGVVGGIGVRLREYW